MARRTWSFKWRWWMNSAKIFCIVIFFLNKKGVIECYYIPYFDSPENSTGTLLKRLFLYFSFSWLRLWNRYLCHATQSINVDVAKNHLNTKIVCCYFTDKYNLVHNDAWQNKLNWSSSSHTKFLTSRILSNYLLKIGTAFWLQMLRGCIIHLHVESMKKAYELARITTTGRILGTSVESCRSCMKFNPLRSNFRV